MHNDTRGKHLLNLDFDHFYNLSTTSKVFIFILYYWIVFYYEAFLSLPPPFLLLLLLYLYPTCNKIGIVNVILTVIKLSFVAKLNNLLTSCSIVLLVMFGVFLQLLYCLLAFF